MRLVYTDIRNRLTDQLADMARDHAQAGKRVFYIAPNSLSFEKERRVLERLPEGASFAITITRFAQMARYFVLNATDHQKSITDTGLSMLFFRVLSQLEDGQLKLYGSLKKDAGFIAQLVDLYKELQRSNLTIMDLDGLSSEFKYEDLLTIFTALYEILNEEGFESQSKIAQFLEHIEAGDLDREVANLVLVVDGFSRFSAEEEALITALHARGVEIVIGTYASQKAYKASFLGGNLYQANVEFLMDLQAKFGVRAQFIGEEQEDCLARLSRNLEARYDFSQQPGLTEADHQALTLWDPSSQKVEIEQVAIDIRRLLNQGVRYKDILVLLGDVASYQLQIEQVFAQYDIPYYLGQSEPMNHHPLVLFVESLERLKRYNFRSEDLLNLLKSGLYQDLSDTEIDKFEQYITYADIKGQKQFSQDFSANSQVGYDDKGEPLYKYNLDELNSLRQRIMVPLKQLFTAKKQQGQNLLAKKFIPFLEEIDLPANMAAFSQGRSQAEIEREAEVWKSFSDLLSEMQEIFTKTALSVDDFLALLQSGMQASHYRTVPATVDVVTIKDYELIEPHTAPYVFALGLTAGNFPRLSSNKSLLNDEERQELNQALADHQGRLEQASQENVKKNHSVMISLLNAATEHLVLSAPQIFKESKDQVSPYLQDLIDLGFKPQVKKATTFAEMPENLGSYKGLLSQVISANQLYDGEDLDKDSQTFWAVMIRRLRKVLSERGLDIPTISHELSVEPISKEALEVLYPADQPLALSASSLTTFYSNQYLYFLRHVLRLEEEESIHPDFRHHGVYLHKIFEKTMAKSGDSDTFDERLEAAITQVNQEDIYQQLYGHDQEGRFSQEVLLDIARSMTQILANNDKVQVLDKKTAKHYLGDSDWQETPDHLKALELNFHQELPIDDKRQLLIKGQIDRVDQLRDSSGIGIVDYKSGDKSFKLADFYNGLTPQLLTYILAMREQMPEGLKDQVYGAMYLHLQDPIVKWSDLANLDEALMHREKAFKYKGIFESGSAEHLGKYYNAGKRNKDALYSQDEIELLLAHTKALYREAARIILGGQFAINPYTRDGRSVEGNQFSNITGFEADRHMGQARRLLTGKREDFLERLKDQKGEH